jgi:YfiH family protein
MTGSRHSRAFSIHGPRAEIEILRAESLTGLPWLAHGFSTRAGGYSKAYGGNALNLGETKEDTPRTVKRNLARFLSSLDESGKSAGWEVIGLRQVHSGIVHRVTRTWLRNHHKQGLKQSRPPAGDGLITSGPGILLVVRTADCLPVMVADPQHQAVGVFHAGWRGTLARITEKGIGEMRACFGTEPGDLRAAIGPGIHSCCYEVGRELADRFHSQFAYAPELFQERASDDEIRHRYPLLFMNMRAPGHGEAPRKLYLDLVEANRRQLLAAGVAAENISVSALCTSCRTDLLFSHRAEKGVTGRMLAVVGIRKTVTR